MIIGLHFLHSKGITHRDIKPANILVDRVGDLKILKLNDFGISKVDVTDLSQKDSKPLH